MSVFGYVRNDANGDPKGRGRRPGAGPAFFAWHRHPRSGGFQKAIDDIGAQETAGLRFLQQVLADHFEEG